MLLFKKAERGKVGYTKNEVTRTPIKDFGDPYTNHYTTLFHASMLTSLVIVFNFLGYYVLLSNYLLLKN